MTGVVAMLPGLSRNIRALVELFPDIRQQI